MCLFYFILLTGEKYLYFLKSLDQETYSEDFDQSEPTRVVEEPTWVVGEWADWSRRLGRRSNLVGVKVIKVKIGRTSKSE